LENEYSGKHMFVEGIAKLRFVAKSDDFCAGPVSAQIDILDLE
jgi:hypothetical protein